MVVSPTKLIPVISAEEQMGKTTKIIDIGKSCQDRENNIFLPYGRKIVTEDFLNKATGTLQNIVTRDDIDKLCTSYTKGNPITYNFIDLLNDTVLKSLAKITRWNKERPINAYPDEADTLGLGEHAKDYNGNFVQKDHLIWNLYESGLINKMYPTSATWWDWGWLNIPFESAIVIDKYEGFKGIEDTQFIERDADYFAAIRIALSENKPLPEQFLNDFKSFPSAMIDIDTRVDMHQQLARRYPEIMGEVNYLKKELNKDYIVGGHSLSRSLTLKHNSMFYSRASYFNRAELNQHLGRVNGRQIPIIIAEPEVIKYRKEDLEFKKKAIEEKVFDKTIDDRIAWFESQEIYNPFNFPSPKAKKNRKINATSSKITSKQGSKENLIERREEVWGGNDSKEYWTNPCTFKGRDPGNLIKKLMAEQHSYLDIKELSYKTMMSEGEFTKFRSNTQREADMRMGKIPSKPGWFYVHIRTGEYYDGCSIYNEEGDIVVYSNTPSITGQIKRRI